MFITRHETDHGARWAADGRFLVPSARLDTLLEAPATGLQALVRALTTDEPAAGELLPPIEHGQEVWASGVTFLRSREARMHESEVKDVYERVYEAERVELFLKAAGWRVRGPGQPIRVRADSSWNVPEPELTLVLDARGDIVGYCAGNDVSSRDIEGENPLYLPQAKVYDGSCALGPGIELCGADAMRDVPIRIQIERGGATVFEGETATSQLKRSLEEIASWLFKELAFPHGAFVMTGTGIVPPDEFNLSPGDVVRITVGGRVLENPVA
jgi:2-dehydro-3-deoxy-D-arabinonate dehydratase